MPRRGRGRPGVRSRRRRPGDGRRGAARSPVERPVLGGEQPPEPADGVERDARARRPCRSAARRARPRRGPRPLEATGASSATIRAVIRPASRRIRTGRESHPGPRPSPRHRARAARRSAAPTDRPGRAPRSPGRRPPRPPAAPRSAPRPGRVRGRRHRDAVTGLLDHLEVVVLVAHRQRLLERDPEPAGEPAQGPALRHARREELEELRVADRDLGPAGEVRSGRVEATRAARPASPTARTFETGWRIQRSRSGTISARAPRNAE